MFQRTVRAVSTLAAVIAILFILSSLLPLLSFHGGGAASMTAAPTNGGSYGIDHNSNGNSATQGSPVQGGTPPAVTSHETSTPKKSPAVSTPVPTPAPTSSSEGSTQGVVPAPPAPPPFLDISQPSGRLMLGALLLLLSVAGLIATRRVRRSPWQR
jgi:hypothetical protein